MKQELPLVSVVIPCRNEELFIGRVLDSLTANDYPQDRMEIIVVDGLSEDRTKEIASTYAKKYPFIKVLDNPKKITPIAMNIGIKNARGDLITKTDAHSIYPKNYLAKCAEYISTYKADAVGGIALAVPAADTLEAKAITLTLSSVFGAGGSGFRTGGGEARFTDTAFGICYRKDVFEGIGLFNENLVGSQDMEFNVRLKNAGGKILLAPDIVIQYHPKPALAQFFKHNIKDGIWAILPMKYGAPPFKLRHLIPLFFVLGIVGPLVLSIWYEPSMFLTMAVLVLYLIVSLYFSISIAASEKQIVLVPFLITAFAARHFGYGIGSLVGLFKLVVPERHS